MLTFRNKQRAWRRPSKPFNELSKLQSKLITEPNSPQAVKMDARTIRLNLMRPPENIMQIESSKTSKRAVRWTATTHLHPQRYLGDPRFSSPLGAGSKDKPTAVWPARSSSSGSVGLGGGTWRTPWPCGSRLLRSFSSELAFDATVCSLSGDFPQRSHPWSQT